MMASGNQRATFERPPWGITLWLWFSAAATLGGWVLSAFRQLNATGYSFWCIICGLVFLLWFRREGQGGRVGVRRDEWPRLTRRFRRFLPLSFFVLTALVVLGGLLWPPANYDGLAYRTPRVLHWLAAERWHWIHTEFQRLNVRATGFEWLSAPLLALTKTDRWLFLLNLGSYLLLPGLVYSAFTRLGVRRRVAWHWMWLLPTGYCFLLQAGSTGNDLLGAPYALAAVDFALRAKRSGRPTHMWLSLLAAALLTACKTSNVPLLLPWLLLVLPLWRLLVPELPVSIAVSGLAVVCSFLPTAVLNFSYSGDWTGLAAESPQLRPTAPLGALAGNAALWTLHNFMPPIFPFTGQWKSFVARALPPDANPATVNLFHASEIQVEEGAGLGMGLCLLLLASTLAALRDRDRREAAARMSLFDRAILWSPYVALAGVGCTAHGIASVSRLIAPYYPLLIVPLLALPAGERVVRRRWWKAGSAAAVGLGAVLVVLAPARPLWPAGSVLERLRQAKPSSPLIARAQKVYAVYGERNDAFAPVRPLLPAGTTVLGLITYDDPETSLWRPFGSRRLVHVTAGDTAAQLRRKGITFVLVKPDCLDRFFHRTLAEWVAQVDGEVLQKIPLTLRAAEGSADWFLVKLRRDGQSPRGSDSRGAGMAVPIVK